MPNMDGLEATQAIRQSATGANVPIIATTANAYDDDRRRCLDAGMNDYLAKPFTREQLLLAAATWLAPKR
jgi:CheY-like chemotaxis protein